MPLSGQGMLVSFANIDPSHEEEFNRWYDKEHLVERVAIPGFLEARRYLAAASDYKYLALYTTLDIQSLDGPAYRKVLGNQTAWSQRNIARLRDPQRAIARVTGSYGQGRGSALAMIRVRPSVAHADTLRRTIQDRLPASVDLDGIISAHLLESEPELSKPLGAANPPVGSGDWYIFLDGTDLGAVGRMGKEQFGFISEGSRGALVSFSTYRSMWDLSKADLYQEPDKQA
jgi:hypothetical protein